MTIATLDITDVTTLEPRTVGVTDADMTTQTSNAGIALSTVDIASTTAQAGLMTIPVTTTMLPLIPVMSLLCSLGLLE